MNTKPQPMKTWTVRLHRPGGSVYLGQVGAVSESMARCAALSRWGASEDELLTGEVDATHAIRPLDDFDVSPA